ncbi:TetR/AcrR family transcriptional regulator [Fodinicola feengrottensis]|uniref:TetR/AcrR family transcriptional regulator n=1 Tax=Fodinicola feengrottensis TaxID=435914 RepID=UPI0024419573|nr:TetR/AcrR family transcriptional regulator [Fodinicola feengrottensis]
MTGVQPYHHGDLRRVLIDHAVAAIAENGFERLSLRDLARRANVSHAAPAYHFTDRTGLLTAVAAQGYRLLGDELDEILRETNSFLEVGVGYVRFAVAHPAHFDVMFRPALYRDDPDLAEQRDRTMAILRAGAGTVDLAAATGQSTKDSEAAGLAGWFFCHGLVTLYRSEVLAANSPAELETLARRAANVLFS